ncbi:hypothetical protein [Novosphingobium acidiphilum]|uniref:hypothetical protein n=1 Tax=Novosphingobium acidiphilum TaxID=505248 RepID=UPI00146FC141|nr:hypothetical protein [Novosphingobium acidiphilum]
MIHSVGASNTKPGGKSKGPRRHLPTGPHLLRHRARSVQPFPAGKHGRNRDYRGRFGAIAGDPVIGMIAHFFPAGGCGFVIAVEHRPIHPEHEQ